MPVRARYLSGAILLLTLFGFVMTLAGANTNCLWRSLTATGFGIACCAVATIVAVAVLLHKE